MTVHSATPPYSDKDKWNQILFENANKNHLHQDNLRWQLLAGFGVFFVATVVAINDPKFKPEDNEMHYVQIAILVIGTLWFYVLHVEGWYYRLYVAYLVNCEERLYARESLVPIFKYIEEGRKGMKAAHPSFAAALLWVAICNAVHVYQLFEWLKNYGHPLGYAVDYVLALILSLAFGIPEFLDALGAAKPSKKS